MNHQLLPIALGIAIVLIFVTPTVAAADDDAANLRELAALLESTEAWAQEVHDAIVDRGPWQANGCSVEPGPISQTLEYLRCQAIAVIDGALGYVCNALPVVC
jgi:hypothetical protein